MKKPEIEMDDVLKRLATMDDIVIEETIRQFQIEKLIWWNQYSKECIEGKPGLKHPTGILNDESLK